MSPLARGRIAVVVINTTAILFYLLIAQPVRPTPPISLDFSPVIPFLISLSLYLTTVCFFLGATRRAPTDNL